MDNLDNLFHDIRNPLNSISMNAELAKLLLGSDGSQDKALKAVESILSECRKCSQVLEQYREHNS